MQFETMYMTQRHDSALGFIFFIFFFQFIERRLQFHIYMYMALEQIKKNKIKTKQTHKKQLYNIVFFKRII